MLSKSYSSKWKKLYTVALALSDKFRLACVRDYLVFNLSPSSIARIYKMKTYEVKRKIQNTKDLVDIELLRDLDVFNKLYDLPLVFNDNNGSRCTCGLCGKRIDSQGRIAHLLNSHIEYITKMLEEVSKR